MEKYNFIEDLIEAGPEELDLTNAVQQEIVLESVDQLLDKIHSIHDMNSLEIQLMNQSPKNTFILLLLKIAKSNFQNKKNKIEITF